MTTANVYDRVKACKEEITALELIVKKQCQERIVFSQIDKLAEDCYKLFINSQMDITKLVKKEDKERLERAHYKNIYEFLTFIENDANQDLIILLINQVGSFSSLIQCYSQYCSNTEKKYGIELDIEKKLRSQKTQ